MTLRQLSTNPQFQAFEARFGRIAAEDLLERICAAHWGTADAGVRFSDIHQHNAANHTLSGAVDHAGETFQFIIHNGDWNGTEVSEFGTVEDVGAYQAPEPTRYMLVPSDSSLETSRPEMFKVYLAWTKMPWFTELLRQYHYDKHFQPGGATEAHYRGLAAKKGLKIEPILG